MTAVVVPTLLGSVARCRRGARAHRGAVSREPRSKSAVRDPQRFHRLPNGDRGRRRGDPGGSNSRHQDAERQVWKWRDRCVLPLPPPAALESEPRRVDGLGAEAREAGAVQHVPSRRRTRRVQRRSSATRAWLSVVRYVITLDSDTVLPRGCGAAARRNDRASAEPRGVRSDASAA